MSMVSTYNNTYCYSVLVRNSSLNLVLTKGTAAAYQPTKKILNNFHYAALFYIVIRVLCTHFLKFIPVYRM